MSDHSIEVFEEFVGAINAHDLERLASLMTRDHVFVESLGNRVEGSETMRSGWRGYFEMCPDYWIKVRTQLSQGDTVLATGQAGGTIDLTPWQTPVAFEAVMRDGRVHEWHVFADNKPVYEILARRPW